MRFTFSFLIFICDSPLCELPIIWLFYEISMNQIVFLLIRSILFLLLYLLLRLYSRILILICILIKVSLTYFWIVLFFPFFLFCLLSLIHLFNFNFYFPDTYNVEHLCICLFAIYISSLVRCLWRSLAHFSSRHLFSYSSVLRVFWYILGKSPLSDVSFANTVDPWTTQRLGAPNLHAVENPHII